jgi:hypothetical protein
VPTHPGSNGQSVFFTTEKKMLSTSLLIQAPLRT